MNKSLDADYDEYDEGQLDESCPHCGRMYDHIDFDYQMCSKCGWDAEKGHFAKGAVRKPNDYDYLNGDADILTGEWI